MSYNEMYAVMGSYQDDLALAKSQNGKLGYKGRNGKADIEFKFDRADSFDQGYALVSIHQKWGLINANGEEVIPITLKSPDEVYREKARKMF